MHLYVSGATGYLGTFLCRLMLSCKLPCTPISFFNPLNSNYIDNLDDLDSNSILLHLSDNSFPLLATELCSSSREVLLASRLTSKFKKVIYFSSSAVYEVSPDSLHLTETSNNLSRSVYANKLLMKSI